MSDERSVIILCEQYNTMNEKIDKLEDNMEKLSDSFKDDMRKLSDKFDIILDKMNEREISVIKEKQSAIKEVKDWAEKNFANKWSEKVLISIGGIVLGIVIAGLFKLLMK